MFKLATLLDNPGEPRLESRYRDPARLRDLGYTGLVLYETTGLSGVGSAAEVGQGEMRRWVEQQFETVDQTIGAARREGLDVFISYDALCLPRELVQREAAALTCRGRPTSLCPAGESTLTRSGWALESLLNRWPQIAGVVLRFGDNDAARLPYLLGNDIYFTHCPRCSQLSRVDRAALVIDHFHKLVAQKHNKTLIVRAWNVRPGGMHDDVGIGKQLHQKMTASGIGMAGAPSCASGGKPDPRLVLSFKFTQTDFWRYQKWNPSSLEFPGRPILYELQCQREFEGKGGLPNWQVPLWRDGHPETDAPGSAGLANLAGKVNFAGVLAWVRGGGWGGPFVKNEAWIDANVIAAPRLAENPQTPLSDLARAWIYQSVGLSSDQDADASAALEKILMHSTPNALRTFYIGPYARALKKPWHPNGGFIQDDLLDVEAGWRIIEQVPEDQLDTVIAEKQQAVEQIAQDRAGLQQVLRPRNHSLLDPLLNTLLYEESFVMTLRELLDGMVAYRRLHRSHDPRLVDICSQRLFGAQSHWNHHTQRHGSLPGAATAFRESHFWEVTQRMLSQSP
ncbi:MAG: hypothetical protein IT441_10255 [Phycisphaeraceae bacterium]|nr:hypothetical protein [Phycisphaeraceae bacterium]